MPGQPLKAGDKARVIGALGRSKSPNVGLIVTVGKRQLGAHGMDHSQFGPIVECHHADIVTYDGMGALIKTGRGDFAVAWLAPTRQPRSSKPRSRMGTSARRSK